MIIKTARKRQPFWLMSVWTVLVMVMVLARQETVVAGILEKDGTYFLSNQNLELTLDKKSGDIAVIKSASPEVVLPALSGNVVVIDAKTKNPILFSPAAGWKNKDNALSFSVSDTAAKLNLIQKITAFTNHLEWQAEIENRTDSRIELAVTLNVSFPAPTTWTYWDGSAAHDNPSGNMERSENVDVAENVDTFPMSCIYTGQGGLSIGLEPHQLLNLVSGIKKETDSSRSFYYTTSPVVLLARQKVPVTFVLYGFNPDYGFRSALQNYYDNYPEIFNPRQNIDPRLKNAGGMALFLYAFADFGNEEAKGLLREQSRRFYATWDWGFPTYWTFTRWGDYYGHAENWPDWYPNREAQLKRKSEVFTTVGLEEMAISHYLCLNMAESGLLEKFYPDAIIRDKDGQPSVFVQHYGGREEHEWGVNLFVDGQPNKLALDTMADLKLLSKELNLPGFSFDIIFGSGQARFEDYAHTLTNNRYHLGVVVNNPCDYVTAFRSDVVLLEGTPYGDVDYNQLKRYLLGHKMGVFLWPYRFTEVVDNLTVMSPQEIKDTYFRLRDYTILTCLKMGNFPAPGNADGLPTMLRYFPVMLELCHAGWEPVVAMKTTPEDEGVWLSRYGRDINSYLVAGNSTTEEKTISVKIDNRRLGEGNYLFSAYQGIPIPQTIKGKDTSLTLKIPAGTPAILKSWLGIQPQGEIAASVQVNQALNRTTLSADLDCSQAFATPVSLRLPEDTAISKVTLNGKTQSCRQEKGVWMFQGKLDKGKNRLEVKYGSTIFTDDEATLLSFPFVKDGVPVCKLVLTNPQDDNQKYIASLLQYYFQFYCQKKENKKVLLRTSVILDDSGTETQLVIEIKAGVKPGIKREGNTLYLRAENADQAKDLARKFMRVLDQKYAWCPALGDTYAFEPATWTEAMKAKGLLGTILE